MAALAKGTELFHRIRQSTGRPAPGAPLCGGEAKAHGEWVYRVKPLSLTAEDAIDPLECGSVSLFVERARAMQPGFNVDESSALVIAAICRRLDGIPLAIEMAAARAATLGVSNLAAHIDDQLRLLNCGRRTALPRHQTLRATLDWSHTLLTHSERSVLRRLAMFRGAFGLEAVKAVAGAAGAIPGGDRRPNQFDRKIIRIGRGRRWQRALSTVRDNPCLRAREAR